MIGALMVALVATERLCRNLDLSERCNIWNCTDPLGTNDYEIDCEGEGLLQMNQNEYTYLTNEACRLPGVDLVYNGTRLKSHEVAVMCLQ